MTSDMKLSPKSGDNVPSVAQQLAEVMIRLNRETTVIHAVLSTEDGLALEHSAEIAPRLAAVAGFMLATIRQSWAMLGVNESCYESIAFQTDGTFLVCRLLEIERVHLILAVLFKDKAPYKRLITQTVKGIQQVLSEAQAQKPELINQELSL